MSYVILGDSFSFPEGNAATNRVYAYVKGFVENNIGAYVVCFGNEYQENNTGIIEKIKYFHPLNQTVRNKKFIKRNYFKIKKYYTTLKLIRKINKEDKIEVIICYTTEMVTHVFTWLLTKIINARLVIERSENPLRYYRNGFFNLLWGNIRIGLENMTLDGILVITCDLFDFYEKRLKNTSRILLVPSTVDTTRFARPKTNNPEFPYVAYFGAINFERDNVDLLINAFSIVHKKNDNVHLVLGGMYNDAEKNQVLELFRSCQIESKAHLLGYLSRNEVVRYLVNARLLVLVRRNDPDTNSSFPSKLVEFLCTGNPVIAVSVGEISKFLTDGDNAFLVKSADIEGLAQKIDYVLNNYEDALDVAKKGKMLTASVFNYRFQANRISEFFKTL
jgi:glycosyltransferase involved in cell wall biosynthesis